MTLKLSIDSEILDISDLVLVSGVILIWLKVYLRWLQYINKNWTDEVRGFGVVVHNVFGHDEEYKGSFRLLVTANFTIKLFSFFFFLALIKGVSHMDKSAINYFWQRMCVLVKMYLMYPIPILCIICFVWLQRSKFLSGFSSFVLLFQFELISYFFSLFINFT